MAHILCRIARKGVTNRMNKLLQALVDVSVGGGAYLVMDYFLGNVMPIKLTLFLALSITALVGEFLELNRKK